MAIFPLQSQGDGAGGHCQGPSSCRKLRGAGSWGVQAFHHITPGSLSSAVPDVGCLIFLQFCFNTHTISGAGSLSHFLQGIALPFIFSAWMQAVLTPIWQLEVRDQRRGLSGENSVCETSLQSLLPQSSKTNIATDSKRKINCACVKMRRKRINSMFSVSFPRDAALLPSTKPQPRPPCLLVHDLRLSQLCSCRGAQMLALVCSFFNQPSHRLSVPQMG